MTTRRRRLRRTKQAFQSVWYKKSLERLRSGEFILGIGFNYGRDPFLNRQYLRIGFLHLGLYLEWEY